MKNYILACVIMYTFFLLSNFTTASEEQIFRDEVNSDRSAPTVSYTKYQKELDKLFSPKPDYELYLEYILFSLGVICLVVVVVFFVRQIRKNLIREVMENEVSEMMSDDVVSEKSALERVDTSVASEDFRSAIRYLYLSAVLHLQHRGILPYDKSVTNREYLNQSHLDNDLLEKLRPAIKMFDEVWYGHRPCSSDTVTDYRALLQQIYKS